MSNLLKSRVVWVDYYKKAVFRRCVLKGRTRLIQRPIETRVLFKMFKARFKAFSTPFRLFASIQSVGNFLNFNICYNVGVVFRLVFCGTGFKTAPSLFFTRFQASKRNSGHVTFRGPTF